MSGWDVRARGSSVGVSSSRDEPRDGVSLVGSGILLASQSLIEWCHDLRGVLWLNRELRREKRGKGSSKKGDRRVDRRERERQDIWSCSVMHL